MSAQGISPIAATGWRAASPVREVLGTAADVLRDAGTALVRRGPLLLGLSAASFVLQELLTGWAASVALRNGPLGLAILFASITLRLVVLALVLYVAASAVRIGGEPLTQLGSRLGGGGGAEESLGHRLKFAVVPMVVLYAAWNLVNWDLHRFLYAKYQLSTAQQAVSGASRVDFSNISFSGGAWKAYIPWAIGCWLVKLLVDRLAERLDSRVLDGVVVYLEVSWVVFGWLVVSSVIAQAQAFWTTREVSVWAREVSDAVSSLLAPLHVTLPDLLAAGWSALTAALHVVLVQVAWPLLWVAVVGLLVGFAQGDRDVTVGRGSAARSVRAAGGLLNSSTRGLREKYYPVVTTTWTLLRSGPLPALTIAVLYALLMLAFGWLRWGLSELVPPGVAAAPFWETVSGALDALVVPLRACFLAGCLAVVLRLQARRVGAPTAAQR